MSYICLQLPVVTYLRNPALKQRHWIKIETVLNHKFKPDVPLTLELLENLNVFSYPNELLEISGQASSESGLESLLRKVQKSNSIYYTNIKIIFLQKFQNLLDQGELGG